MGERMETTGLDSPPSIADQKVSGQVKWFDSVKGFGFILPDAGGPDILLHANVLRSYGQSAVADGARIEVTVQQTPRGLQAAEVLLIVPPPLPPTTEMEEIAHLSLDDIAAMPLEPARMKWFDRVRGFGFANVYGAEGDVFVHIEVLRRSGFAEVQPGEAICIRSIEGRRGRMAVMVAPWEAALRMPRG